MRRGGLWFVSQCKPNMEHDVPKVGKGATTPSESWKRYRTHKYSHRALRWTGAFLHPLWTLLVTLKGIKWRKNKSRKVKNSDWWKRTESKQSSHLSETLSDITWGFRRDLPCAILFLHCKSRFFFSFLSTRQNIYSSAMAGGVATPPMLIVFHDKFTRLDSLWNVRHLGTSFYWQITSKFVKILHKVAKTDIF